jgi:CRP/FNR family cyclic AMP-dependent transcriptional regulator
MTATATTIHRIETLPLFAACSPAEGRLLRRHAEIVRVEPGTILLREGSPGREFLAVLDGTAAVTRRGRRVAVLGPGDHAGEVSLITRTPCEVTVTALTAMELVILEDRAFRGLLAELAGFSRRILDDLARRLQAGGVAPGIAQQCPELDGGS